MATTIINLKLDDETIIEFEMLEDNSIVVKLEDIQHQIHSTDLTNNEVVALRDELSCNDFII